MLLHSVGIAYMRRHVVSLMCMSERSSVLLGILSLSGMELLRGGFQFVDIGLRSVVLALLHSADCNPY